MNVLKNLLTLFLSIVVTAVGTAQNDEIRYFDANWEETSNKNSSTFYRIIKYDADGEFTGVIADYYNNGAIQSEIVTDYFIPSCGKSVLSCGMKNGSILQYYKNGEVSRLQRVKNSQLIGEITQNEYGKIITMTGCISGDCDNGYGSYVKSNGDSYKGNFSNGQFYGTGKYAWANGKVYEGQFPYGQAKKSDTYDISLQDVKDGLEVGTLLLNFYNAWNADTGNKK